MLLISEAGISRFNNSTSELDGGEGLDPLEVKEDLTASGDKNAAPWSRYAWRNTSRSGLGNESFLSDELSWIKGCGGSSESCRAVKRTKLPSAIGAVDDIPGV